MIDEEGHEQPIERDRDGIAFIIGPIFLALAAWFVYGPSLAKIPDPGMILVPVDKIATTPMRTMMTDPPTVEMGGYELRCQECHKLFESLPETNRRLTQHTDIVLDHGLNDRCFNCHDRENRNRLTLPGPRTIPFDDVPRLCATCHGTTYRDWQVGMHGRTNGSWNPALGPQVRLLCTQCHNPHRPKFPHMPSLPGPNTLRMGDRNAVTHRPGEEGRNPLRIWTEHGSSEAHAADGHEAATSDGAGTDETEAGGHAGEEGQP